MPERTAANRRRWWAAVLIGGPGWVVPGVVKMLGGALLAYLAISHMVPRGARGRPEPDVPGRLRYVFPHYGWAVAATALFVVVSQLKINVTNAYAGSLAWSNFFSRLTHSHPGRVVWLVFNTADRLDADGDGRVPGAGPTCSACIPTRHRLDDGGGRRPGDQQAAGPVAAASSSSAPTSTTSTRWASARWARLGALDRRLSWACSAPLAQAFSALHRAGRGARLPRR